MRKMKAVLPLMFVLALVVGCAKPPQSAIDAANAAVNATKSAAAEYAADSFRAAEDAKAALDAELTAQAGKFSLFRSYKKADGLVADLQAKADKAASDAAAGKEQAKNDATTAISNATTALADAKTLLDKAPKGKGTQADLEMLKADLTGAESALTEATSAMGTESYKDAKAKADASMTSIQNVSAQVQAAIDAKMGKR